VHIIVAADLDNTVPDANGLLPMIQAVGVNLGELPQLGLADAGYRSEDNPKQASVELVVPLGQQGLAHARQRHQVRVAARLHRQALER